MDVTDVLTLKHFNSLCIGDQTLILNQLHEILKYRGKGDEERLCRYDMAVEEIVNCIEKQLPVKVYN